MMNSFFQEFIIVLGKENIKNEKKELVGGCLLYFIRMGALFIFVCSRKGRVHQFAAVGQ